MPDTPVREGSAPLSEKGRRNKRPNRRKRAKQWTFLIEKLKLAVDGLYEMCREEQNLNGCKEALMYLQNSSRDFESLIASIHVELSWEEKEKPQAVAWEIRKSMSSPAPMVIKDANSIMNQITPLMFSEVVKAAADRKKVAAAAAAPPTGTPLQKSPEEKKHDPEETEESKDEWQVVLRGRRKKSMTSSMTSESRDDLDMIEHTDPARPSNVYERLASSAKRYPPSVGRGLISASTPSQSSNYMCPKSAMDLPQTKASMAKMAYSRQLLWQRSQSTLIEKMKARQVRSRHADFNAAGGGQRPMRVVTEGEKKGGGEKTKSPASVASDTSRNLTSIRETQEDEKGEMIPIDPKPSGETREEKERKPILPSSSSSAPPPLCLQQSQPVQHPQSEGGGSNRSIDEDCFSFPLSNPELLNLETDREWREMTEEEESLAFEERSLNIEIEQEKSLSIDAELERQVAAEADALEREEEEQRARDDDDVDEEEEELEEEQEQEEEEEEPPKLTREELARQFKQWQDELMADLATASWSEMVERDLAVATTTHLREPGDAALRHERMMSPSRTRAELSEEDLSRRHEQKQRRADELREKLKEEKAARLKALLQKVEEVREKRAALIERKRALMENRLRTANANRERNLEEIVRKAREDEMKVMEAQLIHTLEKGNMRMDQQMREQRNESRRQEMKEERVKKHEEKAAKEAAAEERRKMNDTRSECSALSQCDEAMTEEEQRVETPVRIEEEEEKPEPIDLPKEEEEEEKKEEVIEEEEKKVEKKEKKRKNSKEKKKEEKKEERKEEVEIEKKEEKMEEFDWKTVIDNLTAGESMLTEDKTRIYRCSKCEVELGSEWDAVSHVLSGGHEEKEEEGGERRERVISALSSYVSVVRKQETERKENVPTKGKKRKTKRGEAKRVKENVEIVARSVGGGHGPSVDLWRDLLTAMEISIMGEETIRELTLFGKKNNVKKKAGEATAAFVEEYAMNEGGGGGEEGDAVLTTVIDAILRALISDRSIRESGKTREERETKEIEEAAWSLLRCLAREKREVFKRLFPPSSPRSLRLSTLLLHRVDAIGGEKKALRRITVAGNGRLGVAAAASVGPLMTTLQPIVCELLQRMAAGDGEMQSVLSLLSAPRRLSSLPIAHLIQPPNRHILLSTLIGVTRDSEEALRSLKQHLSPWHIMQFLKSEIDRPKCICPLHTVLPTKESITEAIQYYEKAIL
ncbi:hypothetical protein PENTCL1PPCAC_24270 [Pristionchus entomophagus]|uniref:S phase cyclin A-associated protein in the endoplasmic reticulum N-terminal domain-containing protein n=1 Tax=Pristionchus entomophagus TaxID=358040 RepID=A0AAV5U5D7_9BILA|nr:hypothetical protein PENTCL1PPCAC_24270 [Pristionchus entomophagus]